MFERDKQHLRELGIPLETGSDSVFSDEVGYRVRRSAYALPEISLDADEVKFDVVKRVTGHFRKLYPIIDVDGLPSSAALT